MEHEMVLYKRIERWSNRPGVVAIATLLVEDDSRGPYEVDIFTKKDAITITMLLLQTYKIWKKYYEHLLFDACEEIRFNLWNKGKGLALTPDEIFYKKTYKESVTNLVKLAKEQEDMIRWDYPGRNMQKTLDTIKADILYYERLLNEFQNLEQEQ